jgi:phage shock protein PspC (stress-responsive transcriptional regulator)
MKKTLTVNLNNIVFHIDDDAYEMLQTYLHDIADHFQSDDEKKEIMADIEARIAELFTEKLQKTKNVVNLIDVQEIIEIMGKPSQYAGEDDEDEPKAPKSDKNQFKKRRYYRDPENAILGGVASGLAAYFDWDVTWVRIGMVALALISAGYMIPIYIIAWFVAPQATTASQRLEMQGEDVTVESIKTELNNAKNYVQSDKFKQSASSVGERILEILRMFFKVVFGFVGAVLGIVGVVLVGALIVLLFFLIFEPTVINGFAPDFISNWALISPEKMVMLIISLLLVVGCPIFMLVYWAIRIISGRTEKNHTASWVVLILWLAGLFMFYSIGANTIIKMHNNNGHPLSIDWSDDDSNVADEVRTCEPFHAIEISGAIELILNHDSVQNVTVSAKEGYLPKITTKVENGVLHIYADEIFLNRKIKVTVSADSINSIVARGACQINTESDLITSNLKLELTGASQADMDLKVAGLIDVDLNGASQANLSGSANSLKSEGTGACQLEAEDLLTKIADVKVTGASHANVYASEKLDASATGASEIDCKGSPKNVNKFTHVGSEINVE